MIDLTFLIGCDSVSAQWRVIEPSSGALRSSCLAQNCLLKRVGVTRVVRPYGLWSSGERRGCGEDGGEEHVGPNESVPLVQLVFFGSNSLFNLFPSRVFVREFEFYKKKNTSLENNYPFVCVKRLRLICSQTLLFLKDLLPNSYTRFPGKK